MSAGEPAILGIVAVCAMLAAALAALRRLVRQREQLVQEREVVYNFVHDVSEAFVESDLAQVDFLLERVLYYGMQTTRACSGAIYFTNAGGETMAARAVSAMFPPVAGGFSQAEWDAAASKHRYLDSLVRSRSVTVGQGLVGEVAARGTPLLLEDAARDPRVPVFDPDALRVDSLLLAPMRFKSSVLGVLLLVNRSDDRPFAQADLNLVQALADQASLTIHFAQFNEELNQKRLLDYDLHLARRIQNALLPRELPAIPGVDLAAFNAPAREVGGDYYDAIRVDENHLGLVIADVSGKGVTGALVMSICRSLFRAQAPGCLSPAKVLCAINRTLSEDRYEDMFISVLYAVLDQRDFRLTLARAGHLKPLLVSAGGAAAAQVESGGLAFSISDPETFEAALEEKSITLRQGDTLIAYTDGVTEAASPDGEEWGPEALRKAALAPIPDESASARLEFIKRELFRFVGGTTHPADDMTLFVLRRSQGD
ncbi:MAG: SpoIIE family protein phosphatase [Lentisphaerae bacterium]|nr:SpoIIE family protein phosphatase [Lentisphaerota bacterium]